MSGETKGGSMPEKKTRAVATVPLGKKIKQARSERSVSLDNLANETGFSIDYLKKIEAGKAIPPVGALLTIARALKIDSATLLKEQEEKLTRRIRGYAKRTDNYAYNTLTPGAENKHLKAFRVTIEALQEHKGVGYQHEGEEFVYVLAGRIEVSVGDHVNMLESGETLHFNSGISHHMRNVADERAELLVVIYQP
jgi:quercetin dioxygenase-like cupin family protein